MGATPVVDLVELLSNITNHIGYSLVNRDFMIFYAIEQASIHDLSVCRA